MKKNLAQNRSEQGESVLSLRQSYPEPHRRLSDSDAEGDVMTLSLSATGVSVRTELEPEPERVEVGTAYAERWDPETNTAVIAWDPIPGAAKYSVKYSRDGGYTWFATMKTRELNQTLFNAKPGNVYRLKVLGYDAAGKLLKSHDLGSFATEEFANAR